MCTTHEYMRTTLKALRPTYPLVCACVRNEVWKKNLVLIFYKLENNIMSFIEYQWRENDHFMGFQPDLDLSEGVYRYISSVEDWS